MSQRFFSLKVGPLGPAVGAAEGTELGHGTPGATYGFMNGPSLLVDVIQPKVTHQDQLWRCRSHLEHRAPMRTPPSAAPTAGPRRPTLRLEYGAESAAPEKTTIVLDSPHHRHISHARDGAGSKVSPHRLTSLLASHGVRQTGPSATYVSMYYISRTRSWVKPTIWLPSPPIGLTIHIGAQLHGEPRGIC